jgi:hypothetical protein
MNGTITSPDSEPSVLAINTTLPSPEPRVSLNISEPNETSLEPGPNVQEVLDSQNHRSKLSGFLGFFKNISLIKWGVVIIILAFLGFNIFSALGNATTGITDLLKPIAALFGYTVGETTKQTVKMSAKGTKEVVDTTAKVIDSGVNTLESGLTGKKQNNKNNKNKKNDKTDPNRTTTMKALTDAKTRTSKESSTPQADDAGSKTQQSKGSGKSGYCYIGEDRGFRSCIKVNEDDQCLSGQIFSTEDVCINPTTRS